MGIHKLLERLGFVRLRDFGLILTPDRRLLTTRASVLDDGYGGVVVGWTDTDPGVSQLATWGTKRTVAVAAPEPIAVAAPSRSAVPEPMPDLHTQPIDESALEHEETAEPAALAEPAEPAEDEWEWEIAAARARAAANELPDTANVVARVRGSVNDLPRASEALFAAADEPTAITPLREVQPTDPSRPRTIIPVPTLPSGPVRTYDQRFARASSRHIAAVPATSRHVRR